MANMMMKMSSGKLMGARFEQSDIELIKQVCQARGEGISSFIRRAVRRELANLSYYTPDEKKALGINSNGATPQCQSP
jgi:hypothetical protein